MNYLDLDSNSTISIEYEDLENLTILLTDKIRYIKDLPIGTIAKNTSIRNIKKELLDTWINFDIYLKDGITKNIIFSIAESYDNTYNTNYTEILFMNN